jgi:hypothetical protein
MPLLLPALHGVARFYYVYGTCMLICTLSGDCLNEVSMLLELRAAVTVTANTPVDLYVLQRTDLLKVIKFVVNV